MVNCGSSTVKAALVEVPAGGGDRLHASRPLLRFLADRIGEEDAAALTVRAAEGAPPRTEALPMPDHKTAVNAILRRLPPDAPLDAVGHRVVHGGGQFSFPAPIDDAVRAAIADCIPLAPLHNPPALAGIDACREALGPQIAQVAVFDTAFHATLPARAWRYALPRSLADAHAIRRYGFHGTSHAYVGARAAAWLEEHGGVPRASSRIVTLHLGNGCSACALLGGRSIDTSMGFTPAEGLVMGTRAGDVDPTLPTYLLGNAGMDVAAVERALTKEGGLAGLSLAGADMRDVLRAAGAGDHDAEEALEIFCYRIRKYIGAYAAALGGINAVAFTGGIGENAPAVRARALEGLDFLGLTLDAARNEAASQGERDLASDAAHARILVIPTDEESLIAQETYRALASRQDAGARG